jgi:excisionase family DNA binding protein
VTAGAQGPTPEPLRLLLTPKEAANALGISDRQLWQLTKDGHVPAVYIGRGKRYDPRDLVTYIDRLKAAGGRP